MRWQCLEAQLEEFCIGFPDLADTALVLAPVADHRAGLLSIEQEELTQMAEVRQLGFSTGRHCAHHAQDLLGLEVQGIGRQERVPLWPDHSRGSITHSAKIAGAVATTGFQGIGIDVEETGRVEEKLFRLLFTQAEQARLAELEMEEAATVIFSAKEAGYKAIYPIAGQFIGFQEAEIHLKPESGRFTIDYIGDHAPNRVLNRGAGYWRICRGHVLTLFTIPFGE